MTESLFECSEVLSLFPTPVWEFQLAPRHFEPISVAILEVVRELRGADPPLAPGTSWQSRSDLQLRPELAGLIVCVHDAAERVLSAPKTAHRGMRITGCWANLNAPGAHHPQHSHPNNFLNGIYYVRTPPGTETLNFHDPRVQTGIIRPPVSALTAKNADMVVVSVREGWQLISPCSLPHSVNAGTTDRGRVSVRLNLMFVDYSETITAPLW